MNKPRRVRIYKLSTFDTFTDEERVLNEAYKNARCQGLYQNKN